MKSLAKFLLRASAPATMWSLHPQRSAELPLRVNQELQHAELELCAPAECSSRYASVGHGGVLLALFVAVGFPVILFATDPPHTDGNDSCASCHLVHQSPGGVLNSVGGNANLCQSCHVSGGQASAMQSGPLQPGQKLVGPAAQWRLHVLHGLFLLSAFARIGVIRMFGFQEVEF